MDDLLLGPRTRSRRLSRPLPDDLVWEILSRLPTKAVLKYRQVCKRWRDFISTQRFVEMHRKNGSTIPVILAEKTYDKIIEFLAADVTREKPKIRRIQGIQTVQTDSRYRMPFSCEGLILIQEESIYKSPKSFRFFNPMISPRKEVKILAPWFYKVCGIFFHPIVKEYCILWDSCFYRSDREARFKMLTLGSQPSWRELPSAASVSNYEVADNPNPVIAHDVLYWFALKLHRILGLEQIIAFDIKTEKFSLIPHPNPRDERISHLGYSMMSLLKMDDHLSLVECCTIERSVTINIWILKDYVNKFWMKSHKIETKVASSGITLRPIAFVNEVLVLCWSVRRLSILFACNLKSGTLRNFADNDSLIFSQTWAHVPSLVSLMDCNLLV